MTVREYIFNLITTDSEMNALQINAASTFVSHTLDTPQVRPLCVLRWQAVSPGYFSGDLSPVNQQTLQVWIHDVLGDYTRINGTLKRLRTLLTNVQGVNVGETGAWLSTVIWDGDSDDLRDDELNTLMRNAQFKLTGSAI